MAWHPGIRGYSYGTLRLNQFDTYGSYAHVGFTISWDSGAQGIYDGSIGRGGFISGGTYDARTPGSYTWFSVRDAVDCGG
jgi:hypothetical protein